MLEAFLNWEKSVKGEIGHVSFLLSEKLSDEPSHLISQMSECESKYARMGYILSQCQSWMEKGALEFLPDRDLKEMDRKTELQAKLSPVREVRDHLKILCDSIENRISLGQSILRANTQIHETTFRASR